MTDARLREEPWFVRLDEWQHRHARGMAWYWTWRPLCNFVDRYYRR